MASSSQTASATCGVSAASGAGRVRAAMGLFGCRVCGEDAGGLFRAVMKAAGLLDSTAARKSPRAETRAPSAVRGPRCARR